MKIKRLIIILVLACLVIVAISLKACKSKEEQLIEEARAEATKLWEGRVFSKCGGEFGDYFGKRDGKIYQFQSPVVLAVTTTPPLDNGDLEYEWYGVTELITGQWRTFENGAWTQWQKEKFNWPAAGIADSSRTVFIEKYLGHWINGYRDDSPTAYRPVDCKEIEALHPSQ